MVYHLLVMHETFTTDAEYLLLLGQTMAEEWLSEEDCRAYDGL